MLDSLRGWIKRILRVPPDPEIPGGPAAGVLIFRAGANFYRWRLCGWAAMCLVITLAAVALAVILTRALVRSPEWVRQVWTGIEIAGALALLAFLVVSYLSLSLDYELRWYIVTSHSLRVRQGVWFIHELTMTFANIQEIRVSSGPLQNLLGLANVEVRAAGGAAGPHGTTVGHMASFESVDNAIQIRDLLVERLRRYRDSGLGGSAEPAHHPVAGVAEVEAARALLAEAKALRAAIN